MIQEKIRQHQQLFLFISLFIGAILYIAYYFNYLATPSADYIGNFRPAVLHYMQGTFTGGNTKILPAFPLLLAFITKIATLLFTFRGHDPIYSVAIILNLILFFPYAIITYKIYRMFFNEWESLIAFLFFSFNIYTVYMVVNAELEMFLSLVIVLSLYLTMKGSKVSYVFSFFGSITKWDAVFLIPASMFKDFFINKKRLLSLICGGVATVGIASLFILTMVSGNTYVKEISQRGPNIYRFLLDCYLVVSSFIAWVATQAWFMDSLVTKILLFTAIVITGIFLLISLLAGIKQLIIDHGKNVFPIFIFFSGFLLIHMVYQNSKSRYVLPILWLLNLFVFYGLFFSLIPALKRRFSQVLLKYNKHLALFMAFLSSVIIAIILVQMIKASLYVPILIMIYFIAIIILVFHKLHITGDVMLRNLSLSIIALFMAVAIFYGKDTMDHYSLRRVEFKKAALWFKENSKKNETLLIAELNVPIYYTGFSSDRFVSSTSLQSNDIKSLEKELNSKGVRYIFIDYFYRSRLRVNDKNAIDKKARLFEKILEEGDKLTYLTLVKTFEIRSGEKSYIFRNENI